MGEFSSQSDREQAVPEESAEDVLATRRAFLDITEEDCRRVQALAPAFQAFANEFVDRFYSHLFAFPATAAFLEDPELVSRLKELQKRYFKNLVEADLGAGYVEGRRRIGQVHAEVGLEPQWFLGAFNQYIQHCFGYFAAVRGQELQPYVAGTLSLLKFILLDIGLALDAYFSRSTEQLRKALELYEQSNVELREFAHLASHDIKSPLATVAALCEEFLDEFGPSVPEPARVLIDSARVRTLKMKGMVDDLLSMSTAAAQPVQRAVVSTRMLLDDVLERIKFEIGDRRIRVTVPDQMPEVYTHPGRFREVFYQLISNAVKFMDKADGVVDVSVSETADEYVFCVADNGPGIVPSDRSRVFAPFQRLPQHRKHPGTGLGLYVVRRIVEQRGGRVWVESGIVDGSRFFVAIPRAMPET